LAGERCDEMPNWITYALTVRFGRRRLLCWLLPEGPAGEKGGFRWFAGGGHLAGIVCIT
jgi:hypothetical protein